LISPSLNDESGGQLVFLDSLIQGIADLKISLK